MHLPSIQVLAGFVSSIIFISSNFPMLFKAFRTKDMHSYSVGQLVLGNLGNTVYWLYVSTLPFGPVWFLQGFFSLSSASMLFCYLRYERKWFRLEGAGRCPHDEVPSEPQPGTGSYPSLEGLSPTHH